MGLKRCSAGIHFIPEGMNGICHRCKYGDKGHKMRYLEHFETSVDIQRPNFFDDYPEKRDPLFWRNSPQVRLRDLLIFSHLSHEYELAIVDCQFGTINGANEHISFECTIPEEIEWFLDALKAYFPTSHLAEEKNNTNGMRYSCRIDHLSSVETEVSAWLLEELGLRGWKSTVYPEADTFYFHKVHNE